MQHHLKKSMGFQYLRCFKAGAKKNPAAIFFMQAVLYAVPELQGIIAGVFHGKGFIFPDQF